MDPAQTRSPKEVVLTWVEAFNAAELDELMALYHPEAVNHQVAEARVEGKDNIRAMFAREFEQAEMTCIVEQLFEDGEWAILEWKDPKGLRGCGFFRILQGRIVFQRGYWDKLSFLRMHDLPVPTR